MTRRLNKISNDMLYIILSYLNNKDFLHFTMTSKAMHSRVVSCLSGSELLQPPAGIMFTAILHKQPEFDSDRRQQDWEFITFRGRKFPKVNDPPYTALNFSRYATYSELKYAEYYVRSQAICNRITRRITTDYSCPFLKLHRELDTVISDMHESAEFLLFPCWVNSKICEDAAYFKHQQEVKEKAHDEHSKAQRLLHERNLWHFIKKEEMPRNGVRNVLILNKLA